MSVHAEYPVGLCADRECAYAEPHRHGFGCDKTCSCAGVGAVTQPSDEFSVPTCDWGYCNRETVAERLEDVSGDEEVWLSVCAWHAGWLDHEPSERGSDDG